MKKISNTLMIFIMMFGLLANISMPVYLTISTLYLKDILPLWFSIVNFILSGLILIFIIMLFFAFIFDDNKKQ